MIFIGYKPGSKGYQFWDAAHHCIKISCIVKFKETLFPVKEVESTKLKQAPQSDLPISESDNESDTLGLELVIPAQPPSRPLSPGQCALRSQKQTHPLPHLWFHQACNLLDQVKDLLYLSPQHHDIPFV